ncbi:hypothetical protein LTR62_002166 [Meristemomyces frigidus]|uniref:Ribosomal protein S21 n=1 Tax=Meristemomyces frigidus TaxID=1508187 RepID=A0AAN7YB68_9PEZI|nr:hypothetical protein LTR62_002166 [Meristemomyces frigidus]
MELYKVGGAVSRSSQPILQFLAPSITTRLPKRKAIDTITRHSRPFSTTLASQADEQRQTQSHSSTSNLISSLLDSTLDGDKGVPTTTPNRSSRFKSNTVQNNASTPSNMDAYRPPSGGSIDELFVAMRLPSSTNARNMRGSNVGNRSSNSIASALNPLGSSRTSSLAHANATNAFANAPLPIKLGPSVGRTVVVDPTRGMDVGRAFRNLEMACARNSVRKDFNRQRFHERPGLKRKRLRQERWRKRFKENFKGTIGLVMRMRAQGW